MARSPNAQHNPVNATGPELNSGDFKVPQLAVPTVETVREPIVQATEMPKDEYLDELKFNEDAVTMSVTPSSDKNAAKQIYCAVNGKGAEVWDERSKRWLEFKYVPVGRRLTVKRKYIEVLARSRADTFTTREVSPTPLANQDGFQLEASTFPTAPITIINDPAGERGHQWFSNVMAQY